MSTLTSKNENDIPTFDWGKVQLALQDAMMEMELLVHRVIYKRTGVVCSKHPQLFDVVTEEELEPLTCEVIMKEVSEVFKAVKNACEGSRNEEQ